jgi:hypothetical protein
LAWWAAEFAQNAEYALLAHLMPGVASSAQITHPGRSNGFTRVVSGVTVG